MREDNKTMGAAKSVKAMDTSLSMKDIVSMLVGAADEFVEENKSEIVYERMIQEQELFLIGLCEYKGYIYGVSLFESVILRMDTRDGSIHYAAKIPGIPLKSLQSYHYLRVIDDIMYLVPFREKSVMTWDMLSGEFHAFPLALDEKFVGEPPMYFYNMCLYENRMYLFPFRYRAIVSYDFATGETRYCVELDHTELKGDKILFQPYERLDESRLLLTSFSSNAVAVFHLDTEELEVRRIGNDNYRFSVAKKAGDDIWIFVKNAMAVLKWNEKSGAVTEYGLPDGCRIANDRHTFDNQGVIRYGRFLYAFPASANMAVKIDLETEKITEITALRDYCQSRELDPEKSAFDGAVQVKNKMYLHYQLDMILVFDLDTEEITEYQRELGNTAEENEQMQRDMWDYFLTRF